jgi:hypothetical protein
MLAHNAPAPVGGRMTHGLLPAPCGLALVALLSGCAGAPPVPVAGAHPADPQVRVRPAAYQPVIGAYTRQRPRDPGPWREQNERVTPREKP